MPRMMVSVPGELLISTPKPDYLREAVKAAQASGRPHLTYIYRAMADEGCDHLVASQKGPAFPVPLDGAPVIAVIGDDLDRSMGPEGFDRKSMRRLTKGSSAAAIMVGMSEDAYHHIVSWAVVKRQHVMIVETRPAHEQQWVQYLRDLNPGLAVMLVNDISQKPDA